MRLLVVAQVVALLGCEIFWLLRLLGEHPIEAI